MSQSPIGLLHKGIGDPEIPYVFSKLPAAKALRLHGVVMRVIAEVLKGGGNPDALMSAFSKKDGETKSPEETKAQIDAIVAGVMAIPPDDWQTPDGKTMMGLESLMRLMFEHVKVKSAGKLIEVDLDTSFEGREMDVYKVLVESVKFNLSSFLGAKRSTSSPEGAATA